MRSLYLRAIPVGALMVMLALPAFIVLAMLSLMSKKAAKTFDEMMGGEEQ